MYQQHINRNQFMILGSMDKNQKILKHVNAQRLDLSDYLWHFTRPKGAQDALKNIFETQTLLGRVYSPCISPSISFSEAPLSELIKQSKFFEEESYNFMSQYGVGFRKSYLFSHGALPAIYQPKDYHQYLKPEVEWRHVSFELRENGPDYDYTWQREWRFPGGQFEFSLEEAIFIVPKMEEFTWVLWEPDFDGDEKDGVILYTPAPPVPLCRFVALDEINIDQLNDKNIEVHLMN